MSDNRIPSPNKEERIDVTRNRLATKWSVAERVARVAWGGGEVLFKASPRVIWSWRRGILRQFGAKVGKGVHIYPSARIFLPWNLSIGSDSSIGFEALIYNLGEIRIGERVTVSQRAHLCAGSHDFRDPAMPLLKLPIEIEDDVWVCADAFVGPGVTIGRGAVVGARAVVTRDVAPWSIVAGNPAQVIGTRRIGETGLAEGGVGQ